MKKEYTWDVFVDGISHVVSCIPSGNKYQIWVDDEELTLVYRHSIRKMSRGLVQELQISGKTCLFVVWDERPDLVVDDVMQGSGKNYSKEIAKRKKGMMTLYTILFCLGILVLGFVVASFCSGWVDERWDWIDYAVYILAGFLLIYDGGIEMKHWKKQ